MRRLQGRPSSGALTTVARRLQRVPMWKYSPDQPRDDHGRFGSGGEDNAAKSDPRTVNDEAWFGGLSSASQKALLAYQGNDYATINGALRSGKETSTTKAIDKALATSPLADDQDAYRGLGGISPFIVETPNAYGGHDSSFADPQSLVGATFTDAGFGSTSLRRDHALTRAQGQSLPVLIHVTVKAGTPAAYLGATGHYEASREDELLLARGGTYTITKAHTENTRVSAWKSVKVLMIEAEFRT